MGNGFYQDEDGDVWFVAGGQAVLVWVGDAYDPGRPPLSYDVRALADVGRVHALRRVTPEAWIVDKCPTCGK